MTSQVKNIFIFEISEIIAFHWCIIRPCWVDISLWPYFWWRHNDVTEHFDGVGDVIIRKIVEKYWDRESLKKLYGAVFFVPKIYRITVRPLKFSLWRKSYAHMRLKKRFKIFFSLEFHFIQFKKRKIFHTLFCKLHSRNPRAAPKGIKPALRMKNLSFLNRMKWNYKRNKAILWKTLNWYFCCVIKTSHHHDNPCQVV